MWKEPEVDPRDGHAIVRCKRRKRKKKFSRGPFFFFFWISNEFSRGTCHSLVEGRLAAHVLHFAK
jgi:hypothetical protein